MKRRVHKQTVSSCLAAIDFAIGLESQECMDFLKLWRLGRLDLIDKKYPEYNKPNHALWPEGAKAPSKPNGQKPHIELFTDGACKGNPGVGGWGVLMRRNGQESTYHGGEKRTTNNRMELMAAIEGLRQLTVASKVTITTDSQYVKDGITKWIHGWKKKGWKTKKNEDVKNKDLWITLDKEVAKHDIEWRWVRGHNGHRENEIADDLANLGIEELN